MECEQENNDLDVFSRLSFYRMTNHLCPLSVELGQTHSSTKK